MITEFKGDTGDLETIFCCLAEILRVRQSLEDLLVLIGALDHWKEGINLPAIVRMLQKTQEQPKYDMSNCARKVVLGIVDDVISKATKEGFIGKVVGEEEEKESYLANLFEGKEAEEEKDSPEQEPAA